MNTVYVHSDGGSRGNPGPAAIGVVVLDERRNELETHSQFIGTHTNNVAEYLGLIKALQLAAKYTTENVLVFMDSELVVNQVTGKYKMKAEHLKPFLDEVRKAASVFKTVNYQHVPREDHMQAKADALVNQALDSI